MLDLVLELTEIVPGRGREAVGSPRSPPLERYLDDRNDSRLARQVALQSSIRNTRPNHTPAPGTSMMMSGASSLAALTNTSSARSPSSISSSRAIPSRTLELDTHGALQIAPLRPPIFECPFNFLSCRRTFTRYDEWYHHSLEHFGLVTPPKSNKCCFCDKVFRTNDGNLSWRHRMEEIATHHQLGHTLAHARPDFDLFLYLWQNRIIDNGLYKELMGRSRQNAYPTPPVSPQSSFSTGSFESVFTVTNNPRRSR